MHSYLKFQTSIQNTGSCLTCAVLELLVYQSAPHCPGSRCEAESALQEDASISAKQNRTLVEKESLDNLSTYNIQPLLLTHLSVSVIV